MRLSSLAPVFLLSKGGDGSAGSILPAYVALFQQRAGGDGSRRKQTLQLYDELRAPLYGYLSCLGLKPQEAEDVIQETFLELFRGLSGGLKDDNLRGWLFRVAHNFGVNVNKGARRLLSGDTEEMTKLLEGRIDPRLNPEEALLKKEQLSRLASAASRLTDQQRQCLHLRAEGLRYREIGVVLGVSTQRVADIVQAALVRLAGER